MRYIVVGARGEVGRVDDFMVRLQAAARSLGLEVQAFDSRMVFGRDHILSAMEHAERAFQRGTNVAKEKMVEVLLYAAGERQISAALEKVGLKDGHGGLVILSVGEGDSEELLRTLDLERDDGLLEGELGMLDAFGISEEERKTVPGEKVFDLVLERVARVDLLR